MVACGTRQTAGVEPCGKLAEAADYTDGAPVCSDLRHLHESIE